MKKGFLIKSELTPKKNWREPLRIEYSLEKHQVSELFHSKKRGVSPHLGSFGCRFTAPRLTWIQICWTWGHSQSLGCHLGVFFSHLINKNQPVSYRLMFCQKWMFYAAHPSTNKKQHICPLLSRKKTRRSRKITRSSIKQIKSIKWSLNHVNFHYAIPTDCLPHTIFIPWCSS
jgi:hypothetical protein